MRSSTAEGRRRCAAAGLTGLASGVVITIVGGYLTDAERGGRRRARLLARLRRAGRGAGRRARHVASDSAGVAHRLVHRHPGAPADDLTLLDRVESQVFARHALPKERLSLEVQGGVVVLRGQLASEREIAAVRQAVARVPGVRGVRSLLHLAGTPAPNKVDALRLSEGWRAAHWGGME